MKLIISGRAISYLHEDSYKLELEIFYGILCNYTMGKILYHEPI